MTKASATHSVGGSTAPTASVRRLTLAMGGGREPKIMITKPMKRERTLHQQVRVIYRACRRLYGKEKTQNECLMVFKVVYPELYRLKKSEEERETLDESVRPSLQRIVKSWHPTGRLRQLADRVDNLIGLPFDYGREELIALLEDITPVAMRIRKLTPRECFRLMGVAEKDIDTIQSSSVSKSAQYRLAGNSIVVDTLYHILRKLLVETAPEHQPGEQLTLF